MPHIAPLVTGDPVRLGPFTLAGRIGEGGQGTVYLGENASGERAAIKLLHVKFTGDAAARSRFARELKAAERVASFCTARVISADLDGDTPYIASEYIDGRSLREIVDTDGPLRGATLDRLAIGTATALTAIHHAGIVHRDFKPDNVLIAADGPRVVDFGIARILDSTGTITSRAIGTPAYMAPEQISGDPVGPPTDVFSWASTIMFAVTGNVAFAGDSIAVVLNRILNHDVDVSPLPEPLRGVVRSCLSKVPTARPTADQVLLRLLGHPERGGASSAVLNQGVQIANPEQVPAGVGFPISSPPPPPGSPGTPAAPHGSPPMPPPPSWQSGPRGTQPMPLVETEAGRGDVPPRRNRLVVAGVAVVAVLAAASALAYAQLQGGGGVGPTPKVTGQARIGETTPPPTGPYSSLVDKVQRTGKLVIGVKGDLPGVGLTSRDTSTWTGFDVDVARYIARKLNVPANGVSFVQASKGNRIELLDSGKADLVIATWAINDADGARVSFAGPYYVAHTGVMVKDGDPYTRLADLAGKRLCAPQGSTSVRVVQDAVTMQLKTADTYADCMNLINSGQVDAVPGDDLIIAGFANRNPLRMKVLADKLDDGRYAVGMRRGDVRTCEALGGAIADMYADGTVARLLTTHFGKVTFTPESAVPNQVDCR